jgi:hypothetical protein
MAALNTKKWVSIRELNTSTLAVRLRGHLSCSFFKGYDIDTAPEMKSAPGIRNEKRDDII